MQKFLPRRRFPHNQAGWIHPAGFIGGAFMLIFSTFLALPPAQRNAITCKVLSAFMNCEEPSKATETVTPLAVTAILSAEHIHVDVVGDIRLLGVTVPVANQSRTRTYLTNYVLGKKVVVTIDRAHTSPGYRDSTPPAWVLLDDGTLLNARLIQEGLARPWLSPGPWREWS